MKLIFIGAGSAFTVGTDNYHSNMLLESEDHQRLLIDCGSDARSALFELGLTYKDINHVYISHLHADHVGGLEWLGYSTYVDPSCDKPSLHISEKLVKDLWQHVLAGGLGSTGNSLATYFKVNSIKDNEIFYWKNLEFHLIQTVHVVKKFTLFPSYGLMFTTDDLKVFITTDSQLNPKQILDYYKMSDIIFQDCETANQKSSVHAHFEELNELDVKFKEKMWLYHYNPGKLPDAKKAGFRGFVKKGQTFNFKDRSSLF